MNYTLHHGDCLAILPTLEANSIDAVVCDPPYGMGDKWTGGGWFQRGVYNGSVAWDTEAPQQTIDLLVKMDCSLVVWGGNYFVLPPSRCWDIWNKTNNVPTMADFEMCWTNSDKPAKAFNYPCNGWIRHHPTQKPLALMEWQILRHTQRGDTILDPFMGSGTTGVACALTGRNFVGIELDEGYYHVAERRIVKASQQAAGEFVTISDDQTYEDLPLFMECHQ